MPSRRRRRSEPNHRLNAFGYLYLARFSGRVSPVQDNDRARSAVGTRQHPRSSEAIEPRDGLWSVGGGARSHPDNTPAAKVYFIAATMSGQQVTASGAINATLHAIRIAEVDTGGCWIGTAADRIVAVLGVRDLCCPLVASRLRRVDERTLQRHPFYPDASPQSLHIPMIIGNTHVRRAFLGGDASGTIVGPTARKLIPNMQSTSA